MGRVSAARASLAALAILLSAASGCGGGPSAGGGRARVRFVLEPESARVYSDERFVGSARVLAARPVELRSGVRRFTITADGYFPHDLELDLPPGTTTVELRLRPVPP